MVADLTIWDLLSEQDQEDCKHDLLEFGQFFVKTEAAPNGAHRVRRVAPKDVYDGENDE